MSTVEGRLGRPAWTRAFAFWFLAYRRTWRGSILSTFVYPTLYLASMGFGLGGLVDRHLGAGAASIDGSYLAFVAPGVLAASAMQIGINESSWPVMGAIRWQRTYLAQIATPIAVRDALFGHLAWIVTKLALTCTVFVAISAGMGATRSPYALLEIPAATLTGSAFAAPMAALSAALRNDAAFSTVNRLVIVPLFLFSGTFFPISELPSVLRILAWFTPLYHGAALTRGLAFGPPTHVVDLVHLVYLLAMTSLGLMLSIRTFRKRLVR